MLAGWIGRDDRFAASLRQPIAEFAGIVGPIGDQPPGCGDAPQKGRNADQIVDLAGGEYESQGTARVIGQGMNFGRPSAARSADGVREVPPFAPAAERCAVTCVESTAVVLMTPLDPVSA